MTEHALETPERVALSFEVAGIGHRSLAFLVDVSILLVWWMFVIVTMGILTGGEVDLWFKELAGIVQTILVVSIFAVNWGYGLLFEWAWDGQTPGKRALGLRVIRIDGSPYDFVTSAMRNLSRFFDGFPANSYAVGLVAAALTRDNRRLGDLLAGTLLVKDQAIDLSIYERPAQPAPGVGSTDVLPALTTEAFEIVQAYLSRASQLDPDSRARVLEATLTGLVAQVHLDADVADELRDDPTRAEALLRRLVDRPTTEAPLRRGADALIEFVRSRKPGWDDLGKKLDALGRAQLPLEDLSELDRLYRRATTDLAQAQTFFGGTVPTRYLNRLCARAYREIYKGASGRGEAFRDFWREGFPGAVWEARQWVMGSAGLLAVGGLAGALLVGMDPGVPDAVLGPKLMHTVRSGKVWTDSILSAVPPSLLAAKIFTNNIAVTITAFAGGLSAGLITGFILLLNGGLLGVALAATAQHGVAFRLVDFMAAHGPVELSIIVLAGASGLLLATALVAPGELARGDALRVRGQAAIRIVLGGVPWLVLVGFVEGFISPDDFFPTAVKGVLGLALGGVLWLYLWRFGRRAAQAAMASARF